MARILQIEDNEDIQNILFNLFSEEHDIIQAYSGTEGELLFQSQEIDLVLLDIMLPGKGGEEVLKFIRQRSSVPVIMLTALGDKHLISQYLLDGANDYIVKPFDLEEVYARVSVQLREHSKGRSKPDNIYQVKNITVRKSFKFFTHSFKIQRKFLLKRTFMRRFGQPLIYQVIIH